MNIRQERLQAIIDSGITETAAIIKSYNATYPRQSKSVLTKLIKEVKEMTTTPKFDFPVDGPATIEPKKDSFIALAKELFTIGRLLILLAFLTGKVFQYTAPRVVRLWACCMGEIELLTSELMSIYVRRLVRLPLAFN